MQTTDNAQKVSDIIARYQQELMAMHKRQKPIPPPTESPAAEPVAVSRLDADYPLPDISRDMAALAAVPVPTPTAALAAEEPPVPTPDESPIPEESAVPGESPAPETPAYPYTDEDLNGQVPRAENAPAPPQETAAYTGYLRVFVFTGNTAEPLPGARVTVTRPADGEGDVLFASTVTDRDGFTPVIPLPSVSPALTLRPDIPHPYVAYDIRVTADGFLPTLYENVPVYGDNYVTQPAAMVPLLPGQDRNDSRTFSSNGPADL